LNLRREPRLDRGPGRPVGLSEPYWRKIKAADRLEEPDQDKNQGIGNIRRGQGIRRKRETSAKRKNARNSVA